MATTLITVLIGLTLAALAGVNAIDLYQRRLRQLARQRQRLQTQVETLEQVIIAARRTVPSSTLVIQLIDQMIECLETLKRLEKDAPERIEDQIRRLRAQRESESTPAALNRLCESDAEIARVQQLLEEAEAVLLRRHGRGVIDRTQFATLLEQIHWARLQISALSLAAAGYRARERERVLDARHFFKKAQTILQNTTNPHQDRLKTVRQLGELIRLERRYLDASLFPEYPGESDEAASGTDPASESNQSETASTAPGSALSRQ